MEPIFKRLLLKLSGEVLAGDTGHGFDFNVIEDVCKAVKDITDKGVQVGIVVGGGNFWRGRSSGAMDRTRADSIGMLATVMNSLALQQDFLDVGVDARVMSAVQITGVVETFVRDEAVRHLENGSVVIFAGGTGNPFFSTDSGAALRAAQINADVLLKATNVDGIYDKDPNKFSDAVKFDKISHNELLERHLAVMDTAAAAICQENNIPILVFNLNDTSNISKAVCGENAGTIVS
ncbi:MAG: UMP kinase [Oscillospiraceae bacterium]|nr:UMP kinase [Oscillospiraceae bacterium]